MSLSLEVKKFHFENQSRISGNDRREALWSVSIVGGARQLHQLSSCHLPDSFFPPANDLTSSEYKLKRRIPVPRRVKLRPILQFARVVNYDCISA